MNKFLVLCLILFSFANPTKANDIASIETQALEISDTLRCFACSQPNIETAKDEVAQDLRFFIRKQLQDGKTKDVIIALILSQYGEMISLHDEPIQTIENEIRFTIFIFLLCFSLMGIYIFKKSCLVKE